MKTIQVQGLHHVTIVGSTKQSALDFWQGLLGMPERDRGFMDSIYQKDANGLKWMPSER